jgi:hypothetical protein
MHQGNGDRSFAYCGSHALHISRADVAHGKYSRQARLEHLRQAFERPVLMVQNRIQIASGENEAFVVHGHAVLQPLGSGCAPGHNENVPDVVG